MSGLKKRYEKEIVPALMKEFGYKSLMQAPRLEKVVLNMVKPCRTRKSSRMACIR